MKNFSPAPEVRRADFALPEESRVDWSCPTTEFSSCRQGELALKETHLVFILKFELHVEFTLNRKYFSLKINSQ
jgi:hypothetical protein